MPARPPAPSAQGHFQDLEDHSRDQAQSLLAEIAALQSLNDALRHANANLAVLSVGPALHHP